jgi:hypothetical protein
LDLVRILPRGGGDEDPDVLAAELGSERTPFGLAGEDADLGLRRRRNGERCDQRQRRGRPDDADHEPVLSQY